MPESETRSPSAPRYDLPQRRPGAWLPNPPRAFTFLRAGYGWSPFTRDVLAGMTVGIVAVPLAMAFAIASGLTPERGLFTAVIAGFLVSLLSGSRVQIGGPTGAFVVIVFGVVANHGYEGLQIATLMAAGMLVLMSLFRLGAMIRFIPYPVVTGFTTGIALIIFSSQMRDFFGLRLERLPADFLEQWSVYLASADSWNPWAVVIAGGTVVGVTLLRRVRPGVPGPILAMLLASGAVWAFHLPVETIGTRFGDIPRGLPLPGLPPLDLERWRVLVPEAFTIALLAAIESLLCAVVADGMISDRHDSNTELLGQGFANLGSALFGGLPATGALARTATNIKAGGRSPVSGIVHAGTVLLVMALAAPLAVHVPLAALSGILVVVAWNMSELDHFRAMFRAPRSDSLTMVVTFALTVLVDLTVAVEVGVVLAALLFMRRMTEVTSIGSLRTEDGDVDAQAPESMDDGALNELPNGIDVYEINGPFFFGVADRLQDVLGNLSAAPRVFLLRLRRVPAIDASGLHALEEFADKCARRGTTLVLSGVNAQPRRALERAGLLQRIGVANVLPTFDAAVARARELLAASGSPEQASV